MCNNLRKVCPKITFDYYVLSRHPSKWEEKQFGIKMIKNLEYKSRKEAEGKWFKGLNFGDSRKDLERVRNQIKNCDLLILGAGNFLIDYTIDIFRGPIPLFSLYVFLAKLYHKPIMLYGVTAGPIRTVLGWDLSKYIVENSDIVTVRDELSKKFLEKITNKKKKIHLLPDPVIGTDISSKKKIEKILRKEKVVRNNKKLIALGLRDINPLLTLAESKRFWNHLAKFINSLKLEYEFLFIPQSTYVEDDDRVIAKQFVKKLDNDVKFSILKNRYHPKDLASIYKLCELTISIRLHSAVFSLMAGTPVVSINYLPKVEGFMKMMDLEKYFIDLKSVNVEELNNLFNNISNNKKHLLKLIRKKIKSKRRLITKYSELAISLLNKN